jgi:hypothetical protein
MRPYHLAMAGLILELLGGFLVSVEAIKLQNLRKLRDRLFSPLHDFTVSPSVHWVPGAAPPPSKTWKDRHPFVWFFATHFLGGALGVVICVTALESAGIDARSFIISWLPRSVPGVTAAALPIALGVLAVGEAAHFLSICLSNVPIRLLDAIERKTPEGTIGILGFVALAAGFLLQFYATWAGGIGK